MNRATRRPEPPILYSHPAMRTVDHIRLDLPRERALEVCMRILNDADPQRGVLSRRCDPDPPVEGSVIVTRVCERDGTFRDLRASVVLLDPPHEIATANEGEGPAVRTTLRCEPDGKGTVVTLTSEVTGALVVGERTGGILDRVLFGRSQQRSARATLSRLRELAGPR